MKFSYPVLLLYLFMTSCVDLFLQEEEIEYAGDESLVCVFLSHPILSNKPNERIDSLYSELAGYDFEGRMIVQFTVDEHGKVNEPEIIRGLTSEVNSALVSIVKEFEFEPAYQNGDPVSVRFSYPFVVRLMD